jgi:hypothetical protein
MAVYRVHFLDQVEHDDDGSAIAAGHRLNVMPHLGIGFQVWEDERLVHQHPELSCRHQEAQGHSGIKPEAAAPQRELPISAKAG